MIRRWLSFWYQERPPRLVELPLLFVKVAIFGALIGPALSIGYHLATLRPLSGAAWIAIAWSAAMGAIFAISFYATCALPQLYLRTSLAGLPPQVMLAVRIAAGAVGGGVGFVIAFGGISLLPGVDVSVGHYLGWIVLADAFVGGALAYVISLFRSIREHARRSTEAVLKARMSALQAQINPHFLFNTLNTISALIPIRPEAAQEAIGEMASLFRYALASSQAEMVSLADELEFVENYLKLERTRFADRLRVKLPAGDYRDVRLPGLMLQPLVENAIRHGIAQRLEGGAVEIDVERSGSQCYVVVRNEYDPSSAPDLTPDTLFRPGHALDNIRERLSIYANGRARLSVATDAGWVTATLEVPS